MSLQTSTPNNIQTVQGNGLAVFLQADGNLYLKDTNGKTSPLSDYISGGGGINIYNSNGQLSENRIVNLGGFALNFTDSEENPNLIVNIGSDPENQSFSAYIQSVVDEVTTYGVLSVALTECGMSALGETANSTFNVFANGQAVLQSQAQNGVSVESRLRTRILGDWESNTTLVAFANQLSSTIELSAEDTPDGAEEAFLRLQVTHALSGGDVECNYSADANESNVLWTLNANEAKQLTFQMHAFSSESFINAVMGLTEFRISSTTGVTIVGEKTSLGTSYASTPVPFASLPLAPTNGQRATVNNSNVVASGNFGAVVAGGGANSVPVYYDGANWRIG